MTVRPPYRDKSAPPQQNNNHTWVCTCRHGATDSLITRKIFTGPNAHAEADAFYQEHNPS